MRSIAQRPTETTLDMITLNVIASSLKAAQPYNPSLHRALDKAVEQVRAGRSWTLRENTLEVQSASQPWHMHVCTVQSCECLAQAGVCWHRALCAIAVTASTLQAAAAACTPLATPVRRKRVAEPRVSLAEIRARADAQPRRSYAEVLASVDELL